MPGGSGQNYTANPFQPRVHALPQSNLCLRPLTLDYYCCGHWICQAVPGRITPQLKSNLVSKTSVRLLITYVSSKSKSPLYMLLYICPSSTLHAHEKYIPNSNHFTYIQFSLICMYVNFMPICPNQVLTKITFCHVHAQINP